MCIVVVYCIAYCCIDIITTTGIPCWPTEHDYRTGEEFSRGTGSAKEV